MRVFFAIQSDKGMDSELDERFARAPMFLIYELDKQQILKVENNPFLTQEHGVGIQVANHLVQNHCQIAVGSKFGPKAESVLQASAVRMVEVGSGTVKGVIENINNSAL